MAGRARHAAFSIGEENGEEIGEEKCPTCLPKDLLSSSCSRFGCSVSSCAPMTHCSSLFVMRGSPVRVRPLAPSNLQVSRLRGWPFCLLGKIFGFLGKKMGKKGFRWSFSRRKADEMQPAHCLFERVCPTHLPLPLERLWYNQAISSARRTNLVADRLATGDAGF